VSTRTSGTICEYSAGGWDNASNMCSSAATHHIPDPAVIHPEETLMAAKFNRSKLIDLAEIGCIWAGATKHESREQAREVVSYVLANVELCQEYFHDTDLEVIVDKAARYGWGAS
jgi:hypothetical protein